MSIKVVCPNGHKLAAKESRAGTVGKCPACGAEVKIPAPENDVMSESSILRLLELGNEIRAHETEPASVVKEEQDILGKMFSKPTGARSTQICPQCDWEIDAGYRICPHCHYYLIGKVGEY